MAQLLLEDSKGNKSLTTTMSIVAFIVVMVKVIFSGAVIELAGFSYEFGEADAMTIASILGPVLGTYAWRRHTEATYPHDPMINMATELQQEEHIR